MGRERNKRRKKSRADVVAQFLRPTAQREAHNDFRSAGVAFRVVPVIDTLLKAGKLDQAEFDALAYYREQAHKAEDDLARCGTLAPERMMGGGQGTSGSRIPVGLLATPAIIECARLERDLGELRAIARAVAVDDWSLTRWCIERHGGRERRDEKGKFLAVVPVAEKRVMELARLDLRFAARRIAR
jgi:hypothetical protein